jgi:uncharacterized protein
MPRHEPALRALLEQDPEVNLFLLDILRQGGLPLAVTKHLWLVAEDDAEQMVSVVYASLPNPTQSAATAVAYGDPAGCELLGRWLAMRRGTRMIVGPREPCDALWCGLGQPHTPTNFDQRLYVCDSPPEGDTLRVERAREGDLNALSRLHAAMLLEDLGIRPQHLDIDRHRGQVLFRIRRGRSWVVRDRLGHIQFCIGVGTQGPFGAQVGGTYVPPKLRGQGISTRAMRGVCHELLAEVPRVTLHVNEANIPAVRCYERAGFRRAVPFRLMVVGSLPG